MNQYPKFFPIAGARRQRLAVVCALWHADLVARACNALLDELAQLGVAEDHVDRYEVPGAFEIPLLAQQLARSGRYAAVIACALVVDGGIYRHEFVANAVIDGLMRAQLDSGVPVLSAVLTPHHFHEHVEHRKYFHRHFAIKGTEAAEACVKTIEGLRRVEALIAA
jgi:6,7-dimethyl-8-ribityllumazine synthase